MLKEEVKHRPRKVKMVRWDEMDDAKADHIVYLFSYQPPFQEYNFSTNK